MRSAVESQNLKHPVLWDEGRQNTKAYGISTWQMAYLIGADGKVFWEGNPARWLRNEEKIEAMRAIFKSEFAKAKKMNIRDQR